MTPADIRTFFDGYARAFTRQDAAAICDHYAFPTQCLSENGGHVFRNRPEMLAEMTDFVAFYDKVDFAEARITKFEFQKLSPAFGLAHIGWTLFNKAGGQIVGFNSTYTLRLNGPKPAITGLLGHSEDSAWKLRGVKTDW